VIARLPAHALALALASSACAPDLGPPDTLITSTRVLAVRADPAEAKPGATVTLTPLVASPDGTVASPPIAWSFCSVPRPLTTDDVVSQACLDSALQMVAGEGPSITASTPGDGCTLFGPDIPAGGLRPVDPDATGGYYQPVLAELPGVAATIDLLRITCDLSGASAATAAAFAAAYVPNANPELLPLVVMIDGSPAPLTAIPAGARVDLEASWPSASAETYAYYDAATDTVTARREAMSVAWVSSAGALDTEATGRAATDFATTSDNAYVAPSAAGKVHLWIILRDGRGGVDFAAYDVDVVP
jgi:hypothetical protein